MADDGNRTREIAADTPPYITDHASATALPLRHICRKTSGNIIPQNPRQCKPKTALRKSRQKNSRSTVTCGK